MKRLFEQALLLQEQREQSENSTFAAIVRAKDEHDVLDADDENQRPENERKDADDVRRRRSDAIFLLEALTQRAYSTLVPMSP